MLAELAVALLAFGAVARSVPVLVVTVPPAVALVALGLGRLRGRWLYAWLALGLGYAARRRRDRGGRCDGPGRAQPGTQLLSLVDPGARLAVTEGDAGPVGVVHDSDGLVAVLDLQEPGALLTDATPRLPAPAQLLGQDGDAATAHPGGTPGTGGGHGTEHPRVTVQVLVQSRPAPGPALGNGLPASSYRQLAGGTVPATLRVLVAVRVGAGAGATPDELTPILLGALRRTRKRLTRDGIAARPLAAQALAGTLAELAPHTLGEPVREGWSGLSLGGRHHAVYRPHQWPALAAELVPRLLALPAGEVTVALTAQRGGTPGPDPSPRPDASGPLGDLTIRLAAPDTRGLAIAQRELERLFAMAGGTAVRLDGGHLPGLAATLPLAQPPSAVTRRRTVDQPATAAPTSEPPTLDLPPAGLMMGRNRHGHPVAVRLLRPEPTRAVLVGGGRAAATVVLRALALGAQVVVQTGRPESWDHLLRGVAGPADAVALAPPGAPLALPPAAPAAPQLVVLDVGPVGADPVTPGPWRSTLLVRDDVSTVDLDVLARADLVILQPLRPAEAELVGGVLGLGDGHAWLTRIREDMVGLVSRRTVRWAQLSATPIEQQVIGAVSRVLAG